MQLAPKRGHDWFYFYSDVTFPTVCNRCGHVPIGEELARNTTFHIVCKTCGSLVLGDEYNKADKHGKDCPFHKD